MNYTEFGGERMRRRVSEVAKLSGVSVRTLHYYDEIDLLNPSMVLESGYRYYDQSNLERLQEILFYRELKFSLKEIKQILSHPKYDSMQALQKQKSLLLLQEKRIGELLELLEKILKGEGKMEFEAFDKTEIEKAKQIYAEEVKERWGHTEAFIKSEDKMKTYGKNQWQTIELEKEKILEQFGQWIGSDPKRQEVQGLVGQWQEWIERNFYPCTKEILNGLGEMYLLDERFRQNLDTKKVGTAELMAKAIMIFCKK